MLGYSSWLLVTILLKKFKWVTGRLCWLDFRCL
jgi:hypothetical protein